MKVFGIGLSRTGTKSLTISLNKLGFNIVHYPNDSQTLHEFMAGNYDLSILQDCDGITDITVAAYYAQLDRLFPNSKFILTVRDKESWLKAVEAHWHNKPIFDTNPENQDKMRLRRFLRLAVYGTYTFNADRLAYVYDLHHKNVLDYFKDRPESFLVLNICGGEGWEVLCPFLDKPILREEFPAMYKKSILKQMLAV
ncbi:MAG TPA: hypothetical protein DEG17_06065 [Cyanobacteria bacterium UBA11149]|nr:hypothetical protein [Cyanobacteria bacterium UBA11367]HBE59891.1 hypothetical protein [Cyanobacteria bacterium UBA11366]HBK63547.1 hypothetical protein [Cyanobacteria bacterium UBA11166]HBR73121.1 hypothetical protein [Cyanobacteria bacterium UBA11159]HBS68031.1 hypothetical protein [Cyanobacteria bacterium UBA11153]HBW88442.1 hypothetical protein [Cyanobacteria bacterium UBA11149]HCA95353.1 hypothetical protein [Cyanobacteria bacterium UBA9226]